LRRRAPLFNPALLSGGADRETEGQP
jgi:hypothetical protein